ncbi:MAG TPA: ABC transporter ATP-binding protein [bacterium]|jgi:iron(III) transport system ATP-binding protein
MPTIRLVNLTKAYRLERHAVAAVARVTLDAPDGKIVTLLGPSGCGKSTTLRCIAGLERPDDGEILFDDRVLFSASRRIAVPPERRNVGMVFQSYAIWPHLTVFENVAYPLQVRGIPSRQIADRVHHTLEQVGLAGLDDRPAPFLSGGQQQRVALARALVYEPEVLLLDEPLSNLDAKVREQVREDFRLLQRRLGITAVYVTHDQLEALSLSDVVAVMQHGQVMEVGRPQDLYARPQSPFTASFLGEISYLPGTVAADDGEMVSLQTPVGLLRCARVSPVAPGSRVVAGVRPEHVTLWRDRPAGDNVVEGKVISALYEGTRVKYRVGVGDLNVLAFGTELLPDGTRIYAAIDPARVILLPELQS